MALSAPNVFHVTATAIQLIFCQTKSHLTDGRRSRTLTLVSYEATVTKSIWQARK